MTTTAEMNTTNLLELRNRLMEQETYELFERMLIQQEPFVPTYVKPVSRQSSTLQSSFGGNYTS